MLSSNQLSGTGTDGITASVRSVVGGIHPLARQEITASKHVTQYTRETAEFFDLFNRVTGRSALYMGYFTGCLKPDEIPSTNAPVAKKKIAVDFGCGTGWLTQRLPYFGYDEIHGIDSSTDMLRLAFAQTSEKAPKLIDEGTVRYSTKIPEHILGQCNLVTAVHVHYHFLPYEQLEKGFFGTLSSLLAPNGQVLLVGCPSDHVADTPDHYQNCIHIKDVPEEVLKKATSPELLQDDDGFISLSCLPRFRLEDGTQMKVTFNATDPSGKPHVISLTDTFWRDETLVRAAEHSGLKLVERSNLMWENKPNSYMVMHFKKSATPTLNA